MAKKVEYKIDPEKLQEWLAEQIWTATKWRNEDISKMHLESALEHDRSICFYDYMLSAFEEPDEFPWIEVIQK